MLAEIRRALERIEIGTYGTCARCQRPIAEARLNALPVRQSLHRLQAGRGAGLSVTSDPSSSRPSPRYEVPPPPPPRDRRHERAGAVEWTALAAVCIVRDLSPTS